MEELSIAELFVGNSSAHDVIFIAEGGVRLGLIAFLLQREVLGYGNADYATAVAVN